MKATIISVARKSFCEHYSCKIQEILLHHFLKGVQIEVFQEIIEYALRKALVGRNLIAELHFNNERFCGLCRVRLQVFGIHRV